MNLYHLYWNFSNVGPQYDSNYGFVIRAEDATTARDLAARNAGDEKAGVWMDEIKTSCVLLLPEGEEEVIIADFNAG